MFQITELCMKHLCYDPNYNYGDDDDDDNSMDTNGYDDDDDDVYVFFSLQLRTLSFWSNCRTTSKTSCFLDFRFRLSIVDLWLKQLNCSEEQFNTLSCFPVLVTHWEEK